MYKPNKIRITFLPNLTNEYLDKGQNRIKSNKAGTKMARVDADNAPNNDMKSSILGTQIANKKETSTNPERNRL